MHEYKMLRLLVKTSNYSNFNDKSSFQFNLEIKQVNYSTRLESFPDIIYIYICMYIYIYI